MANAKIPRPLGTYSTGIDPGTLCRTSMPQPGVVGVTNLALHAEVEHAKRALAMDIGQLILDITGIFDPSPISDGTNLLISLARGNWVDAVASAVSIVPYIGDLSKTAKLPRYIKSVRKAIHIAKFDAKWANALRTLFTKLKKVLDECIKLAADMLPDSAKTQLKELKYEVDKFLEPRGGATNKLPDSGKKADLQPSSNSTKSQRNIDRAKPPEKLDKKPEKGYGSDNNNGPKTTEVPKSTAANPNKTYSGKSNGPKKTDSPVKNAEEVIEKSPTLKKDIKQLEKDGWDIKYGEAGKGSYADKDALEIVIDESKKDSADRIVQTLSHEKGHALYKSDPYVSPTGLTKEKYVEKNVKRNLKDEGEATLSNLEVRDEILSSGGPDIGVAGTKTKQYEKVHLEYKSVGDREKAREAIGDIFADGERPSTNPNMNYREYYSKPYEEFYDNTIANKKKP
jgi:type VI secretion system secreted protein VgrG